MNVVDGFASLFRSSTGNVSSWFLCFLFRSGWRRAASDLFRAGHGLPLGAADALPGAAAPLDEILVGVAARSAPGTVGNGHGIGPIG